MSVLCPGVEQPCQQPSWNLTSFGYGSIGVHKLSSQGAEYELSQPVMSGTAFLEGSYAAGDYLELPEEDPDYVYLELKGLGMMHGGLQLVWSLNKIWFFAFGDIQWFPVVSMFVVTPRMARYDATVSFCPAHGQSASKEFFGPLKRIQQSVYRIADDQRMDGFWMFRNNGGLRDAMLPLDKEYWPLDKKIPKCEYCRETSLWRSAFVVGSFSHQETCVGLSAGSCDGSCAKLSPNFFAPINKGDASCMPNHAITPLTSNGITFSDQSELCWTNADQTCAGVGQYYANEKASGVFILSAVIGVIAGLYLGLMLHHILVRIARQTGIVNAVIRDRSAFLLVQETILQSKHFAVKVQPAEDKEQETLLPHMRMDPVAMDKIHAKGEPQKLIPVTAKEFATMRFIAKLTKIANVEVDSNGNINNPKILPIAPREGDDECNFSFIYLERLTAKEPLSPEDTVIEHRFSEEDELEKFRLIAGESAAQKFVNFQHRAKEVKFMMMKLQNCFVPWALLEKVPPLLEVPFPEPDGIWYPAFSGIPKTMRQNYVHTLAGEVAAGLLHIFWIIAPSVVIYVFCSTMFYIRIVDRGVTDFGTGGAGSIWQDVVGLSIAIGSMFASMISYLIHRSAPVDWSLPPKLEKELKVQHSAVKSGAKVAPNDMQEMESGGRSNRVHPQNELQSVVFPNFDWEAYYKEQDRYFWFQSIEGYIMAFVWVTGYVVIFTYMITIGVWWLLGAFLEPNEVAHYFVGIFGLVSHIISYYNSLMQYMKDAQLELKAAMQGFLQDLKDQAIQDLQALKMAQSLSQGVDMAQAQAAEVGKVANQVNRELQEHDQEVSHTRDGHVISALPDASNVRAASPSLSEMHRAAHSLLDGRSTPLVPGLAHPTAMVGVQEGQLQQASNVVDQAEGRVNAEASAAAKEAVEYLDTTANQIQKATTQQASTVVGQAENLVNAEASAAAKEAGEYLDTAANQIQKATTKQIEQISLVKRKVVGDLDIGADQIQSLIAAATGKVSHVKDYDVRAWLERYGLSIEDIIITVAVSSVLLILVLIFIFLGINAFQEGKKSTTEATINSMFTGLAALVSNGSAKGKLGKNQLRQLIAKVMEQYRTERTKQSVNFSLDESISEVLKRAQDRESQSSDQQGKSESN